MDQALEISNGEQALISSECSPYQDLIRQSNKVPRLDNLLATLLGWILFVGFVVFPGTFTPMSHAGIFSHSHLRRVAQLTTQNVPLVWIATASCLLGALGLSWLWLTYKNNYIWLVGRIFL